MTNKVELLQKLRDLDEVLLLELLDIKSDELVDAFLDKIDVRLDYIYEQLEEESEYEE